MIEYEKGVVNRGNWAKIRGCMDRAAAGEAITVGFLGGSITQGSLSSTPQTCYAYLVYRWWAEKFPNAKISYVNAGIGGTNSQFGVARVGEDLLSHKPDFVLTEFSVNDDCVPHFQETYEGLVRTILKSGCALLLMNNVCYDSGVNAEDMHLPVAVHYGVPMVSMKSSIYAALQRGEMKNRDVTPDDLHPNDAGHQLVASCIIYLLETIWAAPKEPDLPGELPDSMTANRYEGSRRYQNHNCEAVCCGFVPDLTPQEHITQFFRRGYTAWNTGDSVTFQVKGRCIGVQYRKSVAQPTPIACVSVDGGFDTLLDGNFKETWGDCLYLQTVAEGLENTEHTVQIKIVEVHENDVVPFYLVSVIGE